MIKLTDADLSFLRATKRPRARRTGAGRPRGAKDQSRRKNTRHHWTVEDLKEKFYKRVRVISQWSGIPCWIWSGATTRGFGYMVYGSRQDHGGKSPRIQAHRLSWLLHNGDLLAKELVGQECGRKLCVNPAHLYVYRR